MNLKKRGLALLMCICMIMTLLPVAAFADDAAVVYGQYTDDVWAEDPSADGTVTSDNITISKTAEPVSGEADTYRINLSVTTTTTTTQVPPGSAATVLVMDVSGSMDFCAECGADEEHYRDCTYKGDVKSSQSRLTSAKAAANSFLDSYGGTASDSGNGRYVAIVKFASTSSIACKWTDVSTSSGLTKVKNVISGLKADGGTNLDAGLRSAAALLGSDAVNGVTSKNVIALTDGQPTFYGNGIEAHGSYGCPDTNNATAASAAKVRALADVYTVCFGVADELCWEKGSTHKQGEWFEQGETHRRNGPTGGAFLRNSIATPASADKTYAYNADNTAELNKAFEAITQEITSGLTTGLKVTDSAGQYIDMTAPSQYVSVEDAYEWTLSDPIVSTDGNKTTYTYTVSYLVKLDTSAELFVDGQYYPTNGETYLTYTDENGDENKLYFEIPGVKGTAPRYTVTYNKGENGNLAGQDDDGNVKNENIRRHSATPAAPAVTADEGYYFTGWDKEIAATVTADVTYTAQYAAKGEITVQANSATATYDGTEKSVSGFLTTEFTIDGVTYTVEGLTASAKGTAAGTYPSVVTGTAVVKDSNGADVTKQFTVNKKDGKLTITPTETELKVVANSNSWVYDGQDHADGGYTVTFGEEKYELKAGESATLSTGDTVTAVITKTVKHVSDTAEGNNVIVRLAVDNEGSYKTVTKVNGTLSITAAPLTITAGSSSQPYVDGVVMCNEYTNTPLVDGDKIDSVKITGQQDGPGKSDNVPSDAVIKNAAGEDVTGDYDITYVNGVLEGVPKLEKDVHFNYIMGYKDETIRPNNNITRAEVATIFFRLLTDESREYYWKQTNDFKDIPDNYWACPAISTLTNAGILKGFTDGNFKPNEPVTRAQMATIIARFANLSEGTMSFTDIEGHWAQGAIELAAGNGWINGYEDGTFRPDEKITRAATMAMINRVLDRHVENVEDLLPDMNVWKDNMDTSYTFYFDIQEATNFHECQRIDNSPNEKWTVKLEDIDWTVYEF